MGTINNDKAANKLQMALENSDLKDVWCEIYPDKSGYTWRKLNPKPTFSRLDYVFIYDHMIC